MLLRFLSDAQYDSHGSNELKENWTVHYTCLAINAVQIEFEHSEDSFPCGMLFRL